jgi:hypothetical protein
MRTLPFGQIVIRLCDVVVLINFLCAGIVASAKIFRGLILAVLGWTNAEAVVVTRKRFSI